MGNHCETVLTEFHHENSQSISEIKKWSKNLLLIKSFSKANLTISNKNIFEAEKSMKSYITEVILLAHFLFRCICLYIMGRRQH